MQCFFSSSWRLEPNLVPRFPPPTGNGYTSFLCIHFRWEPAWDERGQLEPRLYRGSCMVHIRSILGKSHNTHASCVRQSPHLYPPSHNCNVMFIIYCVELKQKQITNVQTKFLHRTCAYKTAATACIEPTQPQETGRHTRTNTHRGGYRTGVRNTNHCSQSTGGGGRKTVHMNMTSGGGNPGGEMRECYVLQVCAMRAASWSVMHRLKRRM